MRSLVAALAVVVLTIGLLASSSLAGPQPTPEKRDLQPLIDALKKSGSKDALAAARWYAEVLGGTFVMARPGSPPEFAALAAVDAAEQAIDARGCELLEPAGQKAASALLAEFGPKLPPHLRAYTLGGEGKRDEAASQLATWVELQFPGGRECPGEHPSSSARRIWKISFGLKCIRKLAPKRDVTRLERLLDAAEGCARTNTAVG